jgi:hypothetical protein
MFMGNEAVLLNFSHNARSSMFGRNAHKYKPVVAYQICSPGVSVPARLFYKRISNFNAVPHFS